MSEVRESKDFKGQDRLGGILVPTFSIRTDDDQGIGDTEGVRQFIDLAADLGFGFIQLLPINEIGPDNSPYNAISSVALEPTTIDCRPGVGLMDLEKKRYDEILKEHGFGSFAKGPVDYTAVRAMKRDLLEEAFYHFKEQQFGKGTERDKAFQKFCDAEDEWLDAYTIYRFLMEIEQHNPNWQDWSKEYNDLEKAKDYVGKSIREGDRYKAGYWLMYFAWVQWIVRDQWKAVAGYGREKNVKLMGDIPIGVSAASADVFADREIFNLEWYGGAPPETHFKDDEFVQKWGQNWGIPLYKWDKLKDRNYDWWRQRVKKTAEICDMFRVDHALGFYRIYAFPWNPVRNDEFLPLNHDQARDRTGGHLPGFQPRPDHSEEDKAANRREGEEYLRMLIEAADGAEIIAEDLGTVPDYVRPSLAELKIAGMKVPQWEFFDNKVVRGGHYPQISFATYTSHDHAPLKTQWNESREKILNADVGSDEWNEGRHFITTLLDFCDIGITQFDEFPSYNRNFLDALFWSLSLSQSGRFAITITDLLYLEDRINTPGIMSDKNWTYRIDSTVTMLRESEHWDWMRAMSKNILSETERTA